MKYLIDIWKTSNSFGLESIHLFILVPWHPFAHLLNAHSSNQDLVGETCSTVKIQQIFRVSVWFSTPLWRINEKAKSGFILFSNLPSDSLHNSVDVRYRALFAPFWSIPFHCHPYNEWMDNTSHAIYENRNLISPKLRTSFILSPFGRSWSVVGCIIPVLISCVNCESWAIRVVDPRNLKLRSWEMQHCSSETRGS